VKDIGVKIPDYTEARQHADNIGKVLKKVRKEKHGNVEYVDEFMAAVQNLRSNIDKNLQNEPPWAKPRLKRSEEALYVLEKQIKEHFIAEKGGSPINFAAACKCQMEENYPNFVTALKTLAEDWPAWQCPNRN